MSSFSSLSSIGRSPSRSVHQTRTDASHDSRPSTPRIRTSTSQASRHPRPPSSPVGRFLVWDQQESLPSSSKLPVFPPRTPIGDKQGHASRRLSLQTPPSYSKVRSRTSASTSHNEVSPVLRVGGSGRTLRFQTHQSEHAPTERTTRVSSLVRTRVPAESLNEAPSLSSSLTSAPSFATPLTPQSQVSPVRLGGYRRHPFVTPSASTSSLRNDIPCVQAQREPLTPSSPSPRSHASRRSQPRTRSSPLVPPHTFTLRRGLELPRARPTLAMSLQVHAPTPVTALPSTARPRSRSRPPPSSRPSSPLTSSVPLPQRPPMPRPPSRSERLLRDTLRRAEEQDRIGKPHPAPSFTLAPSSSHSHIPPSVTDMFATCRVPAVPNGGRRHRRNTSSSMQSESSCDHFESEPLDEDSQEDEDDGGWMWRANGAGSVASSGHGYGNAYYPALARKPENIPYSTPASPSPARAQLQRSAKSSPTVPRRHSHSQSVSHVAAHPPSRTSVDGERPSRSHQQPSAPLTPHEAVLRSKLEGVLRNASKGGPRTRSIERRDVDPGFSSESGNSMASSRNLSGEGDFFFGASSDPSLTSLSSTESQAAFASKPRASLPSSPRKPHANLHVQPPLSRPTRKSCSPPSQNGSVGPLTPPPSPPFNARHAAAQIKGMDGYVSFANIEGLGIPEGVDDEAEDANSRSRWFQWLHLNSGKGTVACDRSRWRSESASSASR